MAKRLRGWRLDQALNRGSEKEALVKGKCSNLATALLSLWSHGKLAATTCRWLAEQAMLDGATHPELHDLAKAGCHGQYPANIQRDICARFIKDVFVPEPTMVTTRCINTKSLKKGGGRSWCVPATPYVCQLGHPAQFQPTISSGTFGNLLGHT